MSDLKIAVPGLDYQTELSTTQFVIPAGAGATFSVSNNIATITTNAAHGLTTSPSAGVMPNYFIKMGGSTSGLTGTGILVGNVFRILSIPSTTTFTIYTTVTAATVTSTTFIPVFYPTFQAALLSAYAYYNPNLSGSSSTTPAYWSGIPYPQYGSVQCSNQVFGANCNAYYNPDNLGQPLDQSTGNTPSTAPTVRKMLAASSQGQLRYGPQDYIAADGTTSTSYLSIVE
jgi:hypothetical protein